MTLTQAEMEARYDATRLSPITSYPTPIPLSAQEEEILTLLLAISEPDPEEQGSSYAERFAAGYRYGQAIARALQAEEQEDDQIEIERHTHYSDTGLPYADPWTRYTLGDASFDIHDGGRAANLCIAHEMIEIDSNAQLLDLAALLSDARVLEALDPSSPE